MIDSNWDVEKYRSDHESNEHWDLRKKFILTHKDRLPEDELICFAQVFINIEFLGCRYPDETMIRVAELAKGVVEEFREKKKNTLKRTFVAASDAASSKVKGLGRGNKESEGSMTQTKRAKPMTFVPAAATSQSLEAPTPSKTEPSLTSHPLQHRSPTVALSVPLQRVAPRQLRPHSGPLGKFVVVITPDSTPFQMLDRAVQTNRLQGAAKYETKVLTAGCLVESKFLLNGQEFSKAVGVDKKTARDLAATIAIEKLRGQCYSIIVKKRLTGQSVEQSDLGVGQAPRQDQKLGEDNVGSKLMRLMGWSGGGLGSVAQGRVEPVTATATVNRAGLGVDGSGRKLPFRQAIRSYLNQWLGRGATPDLLFSTDFDKEQRKIAHEVARTLGLKSQSFGQEGDRRLVVSKKLSLWDLVEELAQSGGQSDKYELLDPGTPFP